MKVFRYLTALGLGAAVSFAEAAAPPSVQAQTTDSTETTAFVATNLVPDLLRPEASDASPERSPTSQANPPAQELVALSVQGLVAMEAIANPNQTTPNTSPAKVAIESEAPAQAVPVAAPADPIETEFLREPPPKTPAPASAQARPEAPLPQVAPAPDKPAAQAPAPVPAKATVDSAPKGTSLLDSQPNLFRPNNPDDVRVDKTETISLEQAIEIARQNTPRIRVLQLQVEQADAAIREARAALSPQVSTSTGLTQSGSANRTEQIYNETDDIPRGNADTTTKTHSTRLDANARIDYNIFQPGRSAAIRASEKRKEQAQLALNQDLSQLRLDVSQDYYGVQEADEQVKISASAVESALKSLQDAQALERAGVGTRFAVLQAEVQLANEEQNRINAISRQNQTRRALARRLSVPENFGVSSSDTVQAAGEWKTSLEDSIIVAYRNRVELDTQLLGREISDAQREIALAATRPRLGAFAQMGPQFDFTDQRRGDNDSDATSRTGTRSGQIDYSIGLQFRWTFLDGGAAKASARQRELDKAIAEEQFETARNAVRQEVENAFYSIQANFNNISTAKKGVQQAASALRLARLRFQAGVGTQSEVVDAERDLTTARGNEVTAILNYNRALVQMRRATGETLAAPAYESPVYEEASDRTPR